MQQGENGSARTVGFLSALGAFSLWGVLPLYWTQVGHVPALEIIWHRVLWGALVAWVVIFWRRRGGRTGDRAPLVPSRRTLAWMVLNGILVVTNWLVYVWAVSSGRTLDASLGYYINPLVSVFLGMVFFGERLSRLQWGAVASASVGVLYMAVRLGAFPWVSLTLAFTFGTYGLIKKRTALSSIHGLALELSPLAVVAAAFIAIGLLGGSGVPIGGDWRAVGFLLGGGVVTVVPLLLFGIAARRIRLSDVGFMQYIAPTLMFLIAVAVFGDPLEPDRLVGFVFVWIGLSLYTAANRMDAARRRRVVVGSRP